MKINNVSGANSPVFSAVYKYKLEKDDWVGHQITKELENLTLTDEDSAIDIVCQHPVLPNVLHIMNNTLNSENLSAAWMQNHLELRGVQLPEHLKTFDYDVYLFSDDDAKDFKKYSKQKSSYFSLAPKFLKAHVAGFRKLFSGSLLDAKLFMALALDKIYQKDFDKFLAKRDVTDIVLSDISGLKTYSSEDFDD